MIGLLHSELLRFRSRRLILVVFIAALVGVAIAALIAGIQSTPPRAEALADARARAEQEYQSCLSTPWQEEELQGLTLEEFCRENFGNPAFYAPSHLALADLPNILEGTASLTSILGLVLGASLMAVSWQSGTISTILTWEPRRGRWYAGRIVVTVAGVFVVVVLIVAFLAVALAIAAALRGSTASVDGSWWRDVAATTLRIGALAAIAAAIGAGVAAIGRHTTAALGVVFVYLAVVEGIVRAFRPQWTPWLLGDNMVSFVSWQSNGEAFYVLTPGRAAFVILGYAALAFLLGLACVRIRDVQ